jgi:predicted dehydrogenase
MDHLTRRAHSTLAPGSGGTRPALAALKEGAGEASQGDAIVNVGVIGCGRWGLNHIRIFNDLRNSRVIAVADLQIEHLEDIAETYPSLTTWLNYECLLNDPAVTAAVVATPTESHFEIVRQALSAGKHVLCEKPLCQTSAEALQLVRLAENLGLVLMTGHVFLFNLGIMKIKELIQTGELGGLHYLTAARTNLGPIRADVNAAYDLAAHDIAIFNWLLDSEPVEVSATGSSFLQPGIEDVVFALLRYNGNLVAHLQASWINPKKVRQIVLVGSKRMVTWDDLAVGTPIAVYDKGANGNKKYGNYGEFLQITMWDGDVRLLQVPPDEPLKVQNRYFLNAIDQGRVGRSDAVFSAGVVRVLEAINQSASLGGRPVRVSA